MSRGEQQDDSDVNRHLRIAIACGAIPLTAGSTIYWLWRYTRWDSLPVWGVATVLVGIPFFIAGMIYLARYWTTSRHQPGISPKQRGLRAYFAIFLLLVNFPAAAAYGLSAIDVMSRFTVRIVNDSGDKIDSVEIQGVGFKEDVGSIPAGGRTRLYIRNFGEGGAEFTARQRDRDTHGELHGYLTGGEDITLHFLPDGKFEVRNNLARD